MPRTVYINGEFLPEKEAKISVFDRGFLFADGVYEVCPVLKGCLIDTDAHLQRLRRSLAEIAIDFPSSNADLTAILTRLIEKNQLDEGAVYLQITRGVADRDFLPPAGVTPSVVAFTQVKSLLDSALVRRGMHVISTPDIRWQRRDIKTIGLLAPSLAKAAAAKAGADDAWMVEDGLVTEGTSNNAYIVTTDNVLITRQLGAAILAGVTRAGVLNLSEALDIKLEERPFSLKEAYAAKEAFVTSATTFVMPIVKINDKTIGNGQPGAVATLLRQQCIEAALAQTST